MRALGRNVLGELGYKVQRSQHLEVSLRPGCDPVTVVVGEGPTGLFLGLIDDLAGVGYLD